MPMIMQPKQKRYNLEDRADSNQPQRRSQHIEFTCCLFRASGEIVIHAALPVCGVLCDANNVMKGRTSSQTLCDVAVNLGDLIGKVTACDELSMLILRDLARHVDKCIPGCDGDVVIKRVDYAPFGVDQLYGHSCHPSYARQYLQRTGVVVAALGTAPTADRTSGWSSVLSGSSTRSQAVVILGLQGADRPFVRQLKVDEVVGDDVVDTGVIGDEGYAVLFALDGEQVAAERLSEADTARMRGRRVAGD